MATTTGSGSLAERADVHKSCKSLETLLNILNDYYEASSTVVTLQKKLVKALREAAALKVTGEIPANALNISAAVFEVSSEIGYKFQKITGREYDGISTEVKKWFRKLAKEERTHDERMSHANARIKQAGQMFEKKSKKNLRDAAEEHARYINLISSLGPEISQEKYNHALNITQWHTSITYSAAACLSRVADAEWLRVCEGVRRFSPIIGQLGEWRILCEGGWIGSIPPDLADLNESQRSQPDREAAQALNILKTTETRQSTEITRLPPVSSFTDQEQYNAPGKHPLTILRSSQEHPQGSLQAQERFLSTTPSSLDPPKPFVDNNSGSVRSLSAFPSPPTHFPLPPPRQQQSSQSQSSQASSSYVNLVMSRLTESPRPDGDEEQTVGPVPSPQLQQIGAPSPVSVPPSPEQRLEERHAIFSTQNVSDSRLAEGASDWDLTPTSMLTNVELTKAAPTLPNEQKGNMELGPKSDLTKLEDIGRSDTGESSGSIVAAIRSRYSNRPNLPPPVAKDIPRLPLSVSDLATRYQPPDELPSPRTSTPSLSRQLLHSPAGMQSHQGRYASGDHMSVPSPTTPQPIQLQEDEAARRQRVADFKLRERELEVRERERDVEIRDQDLGKERARLANVREGDEHTRRRNNLPIDYQPHVQLRPRERKPSFRTQKLQSQLELDHTFPLSSNNMLQQHHIDSTLVPSSPSLQASSSHGSQSPRYSQDYYPRPLTSSRQTMQYQDDQSHAPYCGCETCSASKYKSSPSSPRRQDSRPPAEPIILRPVEKKPGWIRRLSMPVGNAFSLDPSKSSKGIGYIAGASSGHQRGRSGIFSLDGRKNISATNVRAGIQEDGRSPNVNSRSVTNLGLNGGRQ